MAAPSVGGLGLGLGLGLDRGRSLGARLGEPPPKGGGGLLASVRGLREAKGGNLPRTWLRFANRQKGAGFLGSKHASHPINAMLNYAYVIEAGRLAKSLAARGLSLQIGYLRSDKIGRNSLVWDAI